MRLFLRCLFLMASNTALRGPAAGDAAFHIKCRNQSYPRNNIQRTPVPDDKVPWSVPWPDYKPASGEPASDVGKPWCDPLNINDDSFHPKWNALDGKIDRRSHEGNYEIQNSYPLNPHGRTGLSSRGCLGRWGPNHAADPIVTRWKDGIVAGILQFIAIQRRDSGEWAIPGGMVDPGEQVSQTLQREFSEEALNSLCATEAEQEKMKTQVQEFFSTGKEVYKGYVDDPRNTDNSWMETVAVNFHDETGEYVGKINLAAGDDAVAVRWVDIDQNLKLYASHESIIKKVAEMHKAPF